MIDKITEASLLYDFYGQLLTKRKQDVMRLYHEENFSLAEIAEEFGVSRAAVYDSLKSAEKSLRDYEEKLGLVQKFMRSGEVIARIDHMLCELTQTYQQQPALVARLQEIQSVINSLEEA